MRLDINGNGAAPARPSNPDHHLWNNHGTWWCHFTVHWENHTKQRVRVGLGTTDTREARQLRDALLQLFGPQLAAASAAVRPQTVSQLALAA